MDVISETMQRRALWTDIPTDTHQYLQKWLLSLINGLKSPKRVEMFLAWHKHGTANWSSNTCQCLYNLYELFFLPYYSSFCLFSKPLQMTQLCWGGHSQLQVECHMKCDTDLCLIVECSTVWSLTIQTPSVFRHGIVAHYLAPCF
jgi:hypothetical protein